MNETANMWEYKVGINAIIANFAHLWTNTFEIKTTPVA